MDGRSVAALLGVALLTAMGCSDDDSDTSPASSGAASDPSPTSGAMTTNVTTSSIASTATTRSTSSTTSTPRASTTTTQPDVAALATDALQRVEIGRSVEGRPIVAVERGTPGAVVVLVIGVIHGDEDDGVSILERLATAPVPDGVDLWLIESMNPDGQAAQQRGNANLVDLNRNFPLDWGPIGEPGDDQYAGTGPASEPETEAVVDFITEIQPELGLWYHQDLYRLSPSDGLAGELKQRYSELTGVPILPITGGTYTGIAATWQSSTIGGISFIVELGPSLSAEQADAHAAAVLDIATMLT